MTGAGRIQWGQQDREEVRLPFNLCLTLTSSPQPSHTPPMSAMIEWPAARFLDQTLGGMREPEVFQGRPWGMYIGAGPLRLPAAEVRVGILCQLGI